MANPNGMGAQNAAMYSGMNGSIMPSAGHYSDMQTLMQNMESLSGWLEQNRQEWSQVQEGIARVERLQVSTFDSCFLRAFGNARRQEMQMARACGYGHEQTDGKSRERSRVLSREDRTQNATAAGKEYHILLHLQSLRLTSSDHMLTFISSTG
jgi:hypothetical protein